MPGSRTAATKQRNLQLASHCWIRRGLGRSRGRWRDRVAQCCRAPLGCSLHCSLPRSKGGPPEKRIAQNTMSSEARRSGSGKPAMHTLGEGMGGERCPFEGEQISGAATHSKTLVDPVRNTIPQVDPVACRIRAGCVKTGAVARLQRDPWPADRRRGIPSVAEGIRTNVQWHKCTDCKKHQL